MVIAGGVETGLPAHERMPALRDADISGVERQAQRASSCPREERRRQPQQRPELAPEEDAVRAYFLDLAELHTIPRDNRNAHLEESFAVHALSIVLHGCLAYDRARMNGDSYVAKAWSATLGSTFSSEASHGYSRFPSHLDRRR